MSDPEHEGRFGSNSNDVGGADDKSAEVDLSVVSVLVSTTNSAGITSQQESKRRRRVGKAGVMKEPFDSCVFMDSVSASGAQNESMGSLAVTQSLKNESMDAVNVSSSCASRDGLLVQTKALCGVTLLYYTLVEDGILPPGYLVEFLSLELL